MKRLALLLLLVLTIGAARVPKLYWGEHEVTMDCRQIEHAIAVTAAVGEAMNNNAPAGCRIGTADCFAESVFSDEAAELFHFLEHLYKMMCATA